MLKSTLTLLLKEGKFLMLHENERFRFYSILVSTFLVIELVTNATVYKLAELGPFSISAASLIFPLTYLIADITAEVYGYHMAKKLIWIGTVFNIIFALLVTSLLALPSPSTWHLAGSYHAVYDRLTFRTFMHGLLVPFSYFVDVYLLSKWKILMKGRYFWLRSAGSTIIGDMIFSCLMVMVTWWGKGITVPLIQLTLLTCAAKLVWAIFSAYPGQVIVNILKRTEKSDVYDYSTNFNPFKLSANK